jgi:nucleoside-diphosphate-sugar epimerase
MVPKTTIPWKPGSLTGWCAIEPVPIPGNGMHLTQLGHVQDLAQAMAAILGNQRAIGQIYNISGEKAVTFDGLARACAAWQPGRIPEALKIVHYNPKAV